MKYRQEICLLVLMHKNNKHNQNFTVSVAPMMDRNDYIMKTMA